MVLHIDSNPRETLRRWSAMDAAILNHLKQFVEQCKSEPSILADPSLSFFRDYLESFGFKLPPSAYDGSSHTKSGLELALQKLMLWTRLMRTWRTLRRSIDHKKLLLKR
ncbi:hypothetical protein RHSIM_Rhsim07G0048300 [Rhododendron simsii]|uniref:Hsp70-interacting protein N-terminal domain-containing protein n=1 Tax=Rhododendron simsii TaxID=118357 RepID=A0A834LIF4_RHOSS|nr:hypothetical protein RHSIM_Rhsim07G0048300 [Rhododendron simsii]